MMLKDSNCIAITPDRLTNEQRSSIAEYFRVYKVDYTVLTNF